MLSLDFLKKVSLGRRQSSGVMHVYPIIGDDLTENMASFSEVKFIRTSDYGVMDFINNSEKPFIIPAGYAIITKQMAQDHAIPTASFIKGKEEKSFQNACCIEQTQPGFIDGERLKENFTMLPISIRRSEFYRLKNDNHFSFSRLWEDISKFQKKLVLGKEGNLVLFFNRYMDRLSTFTAEFEPVNGQIGAIIMIGDEIVGIEVAPTHEYFVSIWDGLIRGAYGAEVLSRSLKSLIPNFEKDSILNLDGIDNVEDILEVVQQYRKENTQNAIKEIDSLCSKEIKPLKEINHDIFIQHFFKIEDYIHGEMFVDESGNPVYASIIFG